MTRGNGGAPPGTVTGRDVAAALAGSAAASAAVSTLDEEPPAAASLAWRWVVGTQQLDLYAAEPAEPGWRTTCLAAGSALHRARVALAAEGLSAQVTLLPGSDPAHLACLVSTGTVAVTSEALALYEATEPATDTPRVSNVEFSRVPAQVLRRELASVAHAEGVRLRLVRAAAGLAGVLHGPDSRLAWLRAGAALSAVRLTSARYGLLLTTMTPTHPWDAAGRDGDGPNVLRRLGDREGWLGVGIGTPYARLRITPR